MSKRVLLAGLRHETHTFVPGLLTLRDCQIQRGAELLGARGDTSTLAGLLEVAEEYGWEIIPVIHVEVGGGAGPLVADEVVEDVWEALQANVQQAGHIDGVCLDLHGAMVSQSHLDVEGELLRRIRALPALADVPIGGVLDPHGNFTALMAQHSNALIAYRENPHTDAKQAAIDGARLLNRLMTNNERAATVWERPPLMLPPTATATADEPMRTLEALARRIEHTHADILAVNVFAGFAYADMPDVGVSFTAVTVGNTERARAALRALSTAALAMKHYAEPIGMTLADALQCVAAHKEGPVILVEPADNIGGGAPGDLTVVLRGLLDARIHNAGVIINDGEAVQHLSRLTPGDHVTLDIGGKSGAIGAQPLTLQVQLVSTSDGTFELEDLHSHLAVQGRRVTMGPCAVVRCGGITILLTSRATPPFDLAQWRSQGIIPETLRVIAVKAAVAHRQAYEPISKASYTLNTPGPCAPDLRRLPYQHVRRPVFPLDMLGEVADDDTRPM